MSEANTTAVNPEQPKYTKKQVGLMIFAIFTCGRMAKVYTKDVKAVAEKKNCSYLGDYGCLGYDTFGPFKAVGGIQKGHPTEEEIAGAVDFYKNLQ